MKKLLSQLNELRESRRTIKDFHSITLWLKYNSDYAAKHAKILHNIATLSGGKIIK
jgi:hypothetical protein